MGCQAFHTQALTSFCRHFYFNNKITISHSPSSQAPLTFLKHATMFSISQASSPLSILFLPPRYEPTPALCLYGLLIIYLLGQLLQVQVRAPSIAFPEPFVYGQFSQWSVYEPDVKLRSRGTKKMVLPQRSLLSTSRERHKCK